MPRAEAGGRRRTSTRDGAGARRVLFLPGAVGAPGFWAPVAERLPADWETVRMAWPGLGDQPHDPLIRSLDDLVALTAAALAQPADLVAQSLGGVVAARVAARHPELVTALVLVATSGGIDVGRHGAADWRDEYRRDQPHAAGWITDPVPDDRELLASIAAPTLLLWGDADPLSPVGVGRELERLIPRATLRVIPGGTHALAAEQPNLVADLIVAHLCHPS